MTTPTPPPSPAGTRPGADGADRGGTGLARRPLLRWRSIDLTTAAMLGVVFGVVFWGWDFLYYAISPAFAVFPPIGGAVSGVWLLPAVVGALVIRRPGAALFVEMIAATIEALLGNKWGTNVLISGLLQGLGVELAMLLFAWRRFTPGVAALAGACSAALAVVTWEWWAYWADWSWGWKLAYLAIFAASGAVIAGLGAHALVRALARAGALRAFPAGAEARHARSGRA